MPPQPPDIAAERLDEHGEGYSQQDAAHLRRHNPRSRDHQRDPLRRRHRLAPVTPRQWRAHPWEHPSRREERVASKTDREHPGAGGGRDLDAEHEDEERIDLAVQLRSQRRLRPRAPREPAVDEVERERDGREGHQSRHRHVALERGRCQSGDAHRERRAESASPSPPGRASLTDRAKVHARAPRSASAHWRDRRASRRRRVRPSAQARPGARACRRVRPPGRAGCCDRPAGSGAPAALLHARASGGHYGAWHASVCRGAMSAGRAPVARRGPAARPGGGFRPGRVRRAGELRARVGDPGACGAGRHRP